MPGNHPGLRLLGSSHLPAACLAGVGGLTGTWRLVLAAPGPRRADTLSCMHRCQPRSASCLTKEGPTAVSQELLTPDRLRATASQRGTGVSSSGPPCSLSSPSHSSLRVPWASLVLAGDGLQPLTQELSLAPATAVTWLICLRRPGPRWKSHPQPPFLPTQRLVHRLLELRLPQLLAKSSSTASSNPGEQNARLTTSHSRLAPALLQSHTPRKPAPPAPRAGSPHCRCVFSFTKAYKTDATMKEK